jgi:hypothetical protein
MLNRVKALQFLKNNRSAVLLGTVTTVTALGFVANYYNAMDPISRETVIENKVNNKNNTTTPVPKKKNHRDLAEEILMYGVARCENYRYEDHYYPFDTQVRKLHHH